MGPPLALKYENEKNRTLPRPLNAGNSNREKRRGLGEFLLLQRQRCLLYTVPFQSNLGKYLTTFSHSLSFPLDIALTEIFSPFLSIFSLWLSNPFEKCFSFLASLSLDLHFVYFSPLPKGYQDFLERRRGSRKLRFFCQECLQGSSRQSGKCLLLGIRNRPVKHTISAAAPL